MLYIIYKTTNLKNQKFYIGKHQCENLNDNYLGSGINLRKAIKKYGKENFRREILFIFDNELDMNNKEKELVTEELINNPLCYNLTKGGEGGPIFLGKHHSESTKQKLREKSLNKPAYKKSNEQIEKEKQARYQKNNGSYFSEESIQKMRDARNKYYLEHSEKIKHVDRKNKIKKSKEEVNKSRSDKLKGRKKSVETRKKLSDSHKGKKPKNAGKIQINNGTKNLYIDKSELPFYLERGWEKGIYQHRIKN